LDKTWKSLVRGKEEGKERGGSGARRPGK